jgi:hypothetical protein
VNAFQRNFVNEVKRADEMLRRLRTFERHINQFNNEAKEAHQPSIEVGELDKTDLDKVQAMDDLEVQFSLELSNRTRPGLKTWRSKFLR